MSRVASSLLVALAVTAIGTAQDAVPRETGKQVPKKFETTIEKKVSLAYLLYLPKGYEQDADKSWPLVLFLHGAGERGSDLEKVKAHGPPKRVEQGEEFPFVLVSPQCPAGSWWDAEQVLALLDAVVRELRIDESRVYLTGLSMGGYGTWSTGLRAPHRFAAIVPICGGGERIDLLRGAVSHPEELRSLPIWAFHGAKDNVVPLAESERMVEAVKRRGNDGVKLTVYPEARHDSWTEAYGDPKLYEWLLSHHR